MAVFGALTENNEKVLNYIRATQVRLKLANPIRNPFSGSIVFTVKNDKIITTARLESFWFLFAYRLGIVYLAGFIFAQFVNKGLFLPWYFIVIGGVIGLYLFLTSKYFFYLVFRLALKQTGYKGDIKFLSNNKLIGVLIYGDGI